MEISFDELQEMSVDMEIEIKRGRDWVEIKTKRVTSADPKCIFFRLNFGNTSFRDADVYWIKRIAKKHNCRVKVLVMRDGDNLAVDLYFFPKE